MTKDPKSPIRKLSLTMLSDNDSDYVAHYELVEIRNNNMISKINNNVSWLREKVLRTGR